MKATSVSKKLEGKINEIKNTIDNMRKDMDNIQSNVFFS